MRQNNFSSNKLDILLLVLVSVCNIDEAGVVVHSISKVENGGTFLLLRTDETSNVVHLTASLVAVSSSFSVLYKELRKSSKL